MELGCAFHSKRLRGNTQCVLNLLRAESFVQPGDLRRVGKMVCSCRGRKQENNRGIFIQNVRTNSCVAISRERFHAFSALEDGGRAAVARRG